jgi:hypothetical protein
MVGGSSQNILQVLAALGSYVEQCGVVGIAYGNDYEGLYGGRKVEVPLHKRDVEVADDAGAKLHLGCCQADMCGRYPCVDVKMILAVGRSLPGLAVVAANQYEEWDRTSPFAWVSFEDFAAVVVGLHRNEVPWLVITCGWRQTAGFEKIVELFRLDGLGVISTNRAAFAYKFE